jgi:acetyltransferase-like isoleucine patch superfamily enzyme
VRDVTLRDVRLARRLTTGKNRPAMEGLKEIGVAGAVRFVLWKGFEWLFAVAAFPPVRASLLRLFGARIGRGVTLEDVRFMNLHREGGLSKLTMGARCFVGREGLLDLAAPVIMEDDVTLGPRVTIMTHEKVGFSTHPLRPHFPSRSAPVTLEAGCYVGAHALVLMGVRIGRCALVAAGAVVTQDVAPWTVVAGVPARPIRTIKPDEAPARPS